MMHDSVIHIYVYMLGAWAAGSSLYSTVVLPVFVQVLEVYR